MSYKPSQEKADHFAKKPHANTSSSFKGQTNKPTFSFIDIDENNNTTNPLFRRVFKVTTISNCITLKHLLYIVGKIVDTVESV